MNPIVCALYLYVFCFHYFFLAILVPEVSPLIQLDCESDVDVSRNFPASKQLIIYNLTKFGKFNNQL